MVNQSEQYLVSVIMAIYNPIWEKCLFTLESVIAQKNIDFELIVTDDGSVDNLFYKFEAYFNSNGFKNFKLINHKENQGTVKNFFDGLKNSSGKYVKFISPGDALFCECTLESWINDLQACGRKWSFAEAVFYQNINGENKIISEPALPRVIDCYSNGDDTVSRWNYVVLEDVALGAALICEKELLLKYMEKIVGISIYAEDVVYAAMMYDNILPFYYTKPVVFYEFGTGVSTSEKKWLVKVHEDQKNAECILAEKKDGDAFQTKMSHALFVVNSGSRIKKKIYRNLQRGGIKKVIKHRINPRLSVVDCSSCGKWWH